MSDKQEAVLLPCPFCGAPAFKRQYANGVRIDCNNIACFGPATPLYGIEDDAIVAWNCRSLTRVDGGGERESIDHHALRVAHIEPDADASGMIGIGFDPRTNAPYPTPSQKEAGEPVRVRIGSLEWADSAERNEWQFVADMLDEAIAHASPVQFSAWRTARNIAAERAKDGWRTFVDPALAAGAQATVKGLEWRQDGPNAWRAESMVGRYTIIDIPPQWWGPEPSNEYHDVGTVEAAKAAAQADYEARVLSALDPSPAGLGTGEREALRLSPERKNTMTLNLSDIEVAALEELALKQQLSRQKVLIQGLRHYQLLVNGEPDLGPMLPPEYAPSPLQGKAAEPVAWRYRYRRMGNIAWHLSDLPMPTEVSDDYEVQPLYLAPAMAPEPVQVGWLIRELPGYEWRFTNYDPERMPNVRDWERKPVFDGPALAFPADTAMIEALRHTCDIAEAFLNQFNVHDLAEGRSQQWQSLEHQISLSRAALADSQKGGA